MLIDVVIRAVEPPLKAIFKLYRMNDYRKPQKASIQFYRTGDGEDTPEKKLAA